MSKSYSVTSAGVNPAKDRAHRMRFYFIAMSFRLLCVVSLFWVHGWWVLLSLAGAVILPWLAVMLGNAVDHRGGAQVVSPEPLQLTGAGSDDSAAYRSGPAVTTIVVDVPPEQARSSHRLGDE